MIVSPDFLSTSPFPKRHGSIVTTPTQKGMDSRKIMFTSEEVGFRFSGTRTNTVVELVEALKAHTLTSKNIPKMRVAEDFHSKIPYSLDNKRLWVFRQLRWNISVDKHGRHRSDPKWEKRPRGPEQRITLVDSVMDYKESPSVLALFREILSLTPANILNDLHFVRKVRDLPYAFVDVEEYFDYFKPLVVEETRAGVKSGVVAAGQQRFRMRIECELYEVRRPDSNNLNAFHLKRYLMCFSHSFLKELATKKPPREELSKDDIFFLYCGEVTSIKGLSSEEVVLTLGIVTSKSGTGSYADVLLFVPDSPPSKLYLELKSVSVTWCAARVGSLTAALRTWAGINPPQHHITDDKFLPIVRECLYTGGTIEKLSPPTWSAAPRSRNRILCRTAIAEFCATRGLDASQTRAVTTIATAAIFSDAPKLRLLQGPPGTGKTRTLLTHISVVACADLRTLVCAPSNRAVIDICTGWLKFFHDGTSSASQFAAVLNIPHKTLRVGDAILVGNDDKLGSERGVRALYLRHRRDRLLAAFHLSLGLQKGVQLLQQVLSFPLLAFNAISGNLQLLVTRRQSYWEAFMAYSRAELKSSCQQVYTAGRSICNDLPSSLLLAHLFHHLQYLCDAAEELPHILPYDDPENILARFRLLTTLANQNSDSDPAFAIARNRMLKLIRSPLTREVCALFPHMADGDWEESLLRRASVVFCTVGCAGRDTVQSSGPFHCAAIDEASQVTESDSCTVTRLPRLRQLLLVGDINQLPATVTSQVARAYGYQKSLFYRVQALRHPFHLLTVQYRMHPEISSFPSRQFYFNCIKDSAEVSADGRLLSYQSILGPYCYIDVDTGVDVRGDAPNVTSRQNYQEAGVVTRLLQLLHKDCGSHGLRNVSVGVITPYKAQQRLIERMVSEFHERFSNLAIVVNTVDGFQGGEKDVVIVSAVLARPCHGPSTEASSEAEAEKRLPFVFDRRRLNVSVTRARMCNWIVGHADTLSRGAPIWDALICDARSRENFVNVRTYKRLKLTL